MDVVSFSATSILLITKIRHMRVKNINRKAESHCNCGSWLQHWKNFSGEQVTVCRAHGCSRTDLNGIHVQKDGGNDAGWYIVPFCSLHECATGSILLEPGTILISAHKDETCEGFCEPEFEPPNKNSVGIYYNIVLSGSMKDS